jgi:tetratricopeptide (TPR) repeat protein
MKYFQNNFFIVLILSCRFAISQTDTTTTMYYKLERCLKNKDAEFFYNDLIKFKNSQRQILNLSSFILYHGNEVFGNSLQQLCLSKMDSLSSNDYQSISVQQTKNGDYQKAIQYLEKSIALDAKENENYYGWLLLYYYRDYQKALKHLNHFDDLTPNVIDAPVGENIHFLKGLCYYQLNQYKEAIAEFEINKKFEIERFGNKNCNSYIYFYEARCFEKLSNSIDAEKNYQFSIKLSPYATEAYYYLGLLYQSQQKNKFAKRYINKALQLIKKGYKQQDIYVELFDEVYQSQIEESITKF